MIEKGILKKIDDIFNYCEEIDNHLPKEEQTGYSMLPDIFYIRKEVHNLQQKVEQLEKENISLKEANNYHQEVIKSMKEPENAHHYHLENIKLRAINNQLENIIKEAIEYVYKHIQEYDVDGTFTNLDEFDFIASPQDLLNILNKGDNK